jgi:hypothetical protein
MRNEKRGADTTACMYVSDQRRLVVIAIGKQNRSRLILPPVDAVQSHVPLTPVLILAYSIDVFEGLSL